MIMNSKDYYISLVKRFVGEYFPGSVGVMLTGSFVSEYFNEYSDLDVIILSVWHHKTFIESYEYEEIKIQIIALPFYDSHGILLRDSMSRNGAIISMLSKGLILRDDKGHMGKLKSKAMALISQKRFVPKEQLNLERSKLTTAYGDVCGNSDREDLVFSIVDAMPKALNMYYMLNGAWLHHGKSASRELRTTNSAFLKRYVKAVDSFFIDGDKAPIVDLLRGLLDSAGGELHYHTTKTYKEIVDCEDMVVYVAPRSNDRELESLREIERAFHDFIKLRDNALRLVSLINRDDNVMSRGLYIIISSTREQLNDNIVPLIREFHLGNPVSVRSGLIEQWHYPYMLNPLLIHSVFAKPVFDFLCSVNRDKYRCSSKIQYAIELLSGIDKCTEASGALTSQGVWTQVFEIFLSSHVNKMLPSNCMELVCDVKRQKIITDYESMRHELTKQEPPSCPICNYGQILNSIQESLGKDSSDLFSRADDLAVLSVYKLANVVLDVIGANSVDDKLIVSYFLSQRS